MLSLATENLRAVAAPGSARDSDVLAVAAGRGRGHWPDTSAAPASAASIVPPHGTQPSNNGLGDEMAQTIAHSL
jgi:hypothetical protein